jgi:hypothetical protein
MLLTTELNAMSFRTASAVRNLQFYKRNADSHSTSSQRSAAQGRLSWLKPLGMTWPLTDVTSSRLYAAGDGSNHNERLFAGRDFVGQGRVWQLER